VSLTAGSRLGAYEVLGLIGAGGMGEVYRARDTRLGRDVAIKVLPDQVASNCVRLARFEREARAVATLNHPNILTVFDVGTHGNTHYFVAELLQGETLREMSRRRAPTQRQVLSFAVQVAQGLDAAHAKGIVHRDIKPENVFVTTDGRVKVLDFGLAKLADRVTAASDEATDSSPTGAGQLVGTLSFMSPEQVRGLPIDHRTDIFSFGVLLYELLSGRHPFRRETTVATLTAILDAEPAELASLNCGVPPALSGIVRTCLEKSREDRFHSAHDLARALEGVLGAPAGSVRLQEVEEKSPYPGLLSFTEKDAASFFGREAEVKALWQRLQCRRLLAVIGPSGTGKTSFVRAGVIPAAPEGWRCLWVTPGDRPFAALVRALVPELSNDPETLQRLVGAETADELLVALGAWRRRHGEVLLVVDQFEELFTLNPGEVQERFAALLGRLASEADVHMLFSLRDDFLMRSQEQSPLHPILADLTALLPLSAEALHSALVEPAKRCGYRFEDEALVAEMIESVEGARGALPLLAFAVSRLWERRDRESRRLTRAAYEEIGGVAGALARHAEATMDRIGTEQQTVREIFRNLVTSHGTRAVVDREELLSAFPERKDAESVLRGLIDARLVTSYDVAGAEGEPSQHRVEVVHESLLSAWPRLVRWQAQDEEGSLLRDQLKQAAHLWQEKGRASDLLWSGTSFREFELWRERYQGQLTALEEQFAKSMTDRRRRMRRLRRAAVASLVVALGTVAIVLSVLRQEAVRQARRAEAGKLVALGRTQIDTYPTAALAYARKSLEVADTGEARRLALEALWRSPTARILPIEHNGSWSAAFSPDGHRLAAYTFSEFVLLFSEDGSPARELGGFKPPTSPTAVSFTSDGSALVTWTPWETAFRMVSVANGREIRRFRLELPDGRPGKLRDFDFLDEGLLFLVAGSEAHDPRAHLGLWPYDGRPPTFVGPRGEGALGWQLVDKQGLRLVRRRSRRVFLHDVAGGLSSWPAPAQGASGLVSSDGRRLALEEGSGRLRVVSSGSPAETPRELRFANADVQSPPAFDSSGSLLAWGSSADKQVALWDVSAPLDTAPRLLRRPDAPATKATLFHPRGDWLAVLNYETATFWAIHQPWPRVLRGPTGNVFQIAFTPDSRGLLSCAYDGVHVWPLDPGSGSGHRRISEEKLCYTMAPSPDKRELLWGAIGVRRSTIADRQERSVLAPLSGEGEVNETTKGVAIDRSGQKAATATGYSRPPTHKYLRIWDWPSGRLLKEFPLTPPEEAEDLWAWSANALAFDARGRVLVAGAGGIRRFDAETGASEWIRRLPRDSGATMAATADAGLLFVREGSSRLCRGLLVNPASGEARSIASHGAALTAVAIDPAGRVLVSGDNEGAVRVGRADGSEPHLLLGHGGSVEAVALSPDGQWVASASGGEIRLWPMPDLSKAPLHTLPHDVLMARLNALTNLRVVEDASAATGYKLGVGPFPGWKDPPTW
jgi:WD40 repeat protein